MWVRLVLRAVSSADGIARKSSHYGQTGFTSRAHHLSRQSNLEKKTSKRRLLMGSVVIQCPATGRTIPTGIEADRLKFSCSPVFFADAYCPHCNSSHRWFARDAWVEERSSRSIAEAA